MTPEDWAALDTWRACGRPIVGYPRGAEFEQLEQDWRDKAEQEYRSGDTDD